MSVPLGPVLRTVWLHAPLQTRLQKCQRCCPVSMVPFGSDWAQSTIPHHASSLLLPTGTHLGNLWADCKHPSTSCPWRMPTRVASMSIVQPHYYFISDLSKSQGNAVIIIRVDQHRSPSLSGQSLSQDSPHLLHSWAYFWTCSTTSVSQKILWVINAHSLYPAPGQTLWRLGGSL